ncbi:MAG: hypothetical protein ABNH53_10145 [Henriciella sp.]|jgi:hypothetical protein
MDDFDPIPQVEDNSPIGLTDVFDPLDPSYIGFDAQFTTESGVVSAEGLALLFQMGFTSNNFDAADVNEDNQMTSEELEAILDSETTDDGIPLRDAFRF